MTHPRAVAPGRVDATPGSRSVTDIAARTPGHIVYVAPSRAGEPIGPGRRYAGCSSNLEERIPMTTRPDTQPRAARTWHWLALPILLLAGCVSVPPTTAVLAPEAPPVAVERAGRRRRRRASAPAADAASGGAGRGAGRRAGAGRSAAPGSPPRPRLARRARRPLGARAPRLRDARPRQRPRPRPRALVRDAARLRRAHDRARRALSLLHRRRARQARHADRARAAAVHRERLQPAGDVGRARLRHVAVHPVDRPRLRAQAERLSRRPPRRPRLDPRRARLPAEAVRHVRRLASRAGRLQLGRRQRAARDRQEPARRPGRPTT